MDIDSHPERSALPTKGTSEPSICTSMKQFDTLFGKTDAPGIIDDWIYTDLPALDIYISKFANATLVRVTWLHVYMDATGLKDLFDGWMAVLRGREDQVPPFHGLSGDLAVCLGVHSKPEKWVCWNNVLRGVGKMFFIFRALIASWWMPTSDIRLVCVPGWFVSKLRETAMNELTESKSDDKGEKPFISESDILLAWKARTINRAINPSPQKSISILNTLNIRPILPDLFPTNAAYMGNAMMLAFTYLPFAAINNNPLGTTASQICQSIVTQRTREQVEVFAAIERQSFQRSGQPAIIGSPNMLIFVCANWHQSRYFDVDFSPAVVKRKGERVSPVGKPALVVPGMPEIRMPMASITHII